MLLSLLRGTNSFPQIIAYVLSAVCVIFLSSPIHEYSHALIADKLGDRTARYQGRLSVNPFAHIDYFGSLCILLFGFGWAKPVPVNACNFKNPKRDMALVALAGPVSNLIIGFVSVLLQSFFYYIVYFATFNSVMYYVCIFFEYLAIINISLAVFNLIPIPPLDGSRILTVFLPTKLYFSIMRYERYIVWGIIILLWTGILTKPLNYLVTLLYNAFLTVSRFIFEFR